MNGLRLISRVENHTEALYKLNLDYPLTMDDKGYQKLAEAIHGSNEIRGETR